MTDALIMLAVVAVVVVLAMRVGYRLGRDAGVAVGRKQGYENAWKVLGRKNDV